MTNEPTNKAVIESGDPNTNRLELLLNEVKRETKGITGGLFLLPILLYILSGASCNDRKKIEPDTGLCYQSDLTISFPWPTERRSYCPCTPQVLEQIPEDEKLQLKPSVSPVTSWAPMPSISATTPK